MHDSRDENGFAPTSPIKRSRQVGPNRQSRRRFCPLVGYERATRTRLAVGIGDTKPRHIAVFRTHSHPRKSFSVKAFWPVPRPSSVPPHISTLIMGARPSSKQLDYTLLGTIPITVTSPNRSTRPGSGCGTWAPAANR